MTGGHGNGPFPPTTESIPNGGISAGLNHDIYDFVRKQAGPGSKVGKSLNVSRDHAPITFRRVFPTSPFERHRKTNIRCNRE